MDRKIKVTNSVKNTNEIFKNSSKVKKISISICLCLGIISVFWIPNLYVLASAKTNESETYY